MTRNKTLKLALLSLTIMGNLQAQTTGTVYFSSGSPTQLYYLQNPGTASVSAVPVGSPTASYNAMGYNSLDGSLYAISTDGNVLRINPSNGAVAVLNITLPSGHNYAAGAVAGNMMYVINMDGSAATRMLYQINLGAGTYTSVVQGSPIADLAYYNGYLYGYDAQADQVYKINPSNGVKTSVGSGFGPGGIASVWSDGAGMIYFDRRGTYNTNAGVLTYNAGEGTYTSGVAGSGSGIDDAAWSPIAIITPLTDGGTIAVSQSNCGAFDPAPITSTTDASGGNGASVEYRWWANGAIIPGATASTYDPGSISVTTNYQREARRGNTAWVASNVITMSVNSAPTVSVATDVTAQCYGDSLTLTASGASLYSWNNGATTASIKVAPNTTTTYTVMGADNNGCTATASQTVDPPFTATINASIATSDLSRVCEGTSVTLTASGGDTYIWMDGDTNAARVVTATPGNDKYTVVVGKSGCNITDTASVTVYGKGCNQLDLAANIQVDNTIAPDGTSISVTFNVVNLTAEASQGNIQFTIPIPDANSGMALSFTPSSNWTIINNLTSYTVTSTTAITADETRALNATLTRQGGAPGTFELSMTLEINGDNNTSNNTAQAQVMKL